jgi:peptidoglycan/xylan/chitin deacetylase (PgdA/CDA1 family)
MAEGRALPPNGVVSLSMTAIAIIWKTPLPVLQEFGFPATIYIVVNAVGRDNFWHDPVSETRLPMLTWEEISALHEAGWDIGSHTLTHPRLTRLSSVEAKHEIEESRRVLGEKVGVPPVSLPTRTGTEPIGATFVA